MEKNLFKVLCYNINQGNIYVDLVKDNCVIPITIDVKNYEFWLMTNNKLEWTLIHTEKPSSITTTAGKLSKQEYWNDVPIKSVMDDMYEYICSNPIMFNGILFEDSINSILSAFLNFK